jgi:hypothetical protein
MRPDSQRFLTTRIGLWTNTPDFNVTAFRLSAARAGSPGQPD